MTVPAESHVDLLVNWHVPPGSHSLVSFFQWTPKSTEFLNHDADLCHHLGWPAGTSGVLVQAFGHNLPRNQGWDLTQLPQESMDPFIKASHVYKRGVALFPHKAPLIPQNSGSYAIHCTSTWSWEAILRKPAHVVVDQNVAQAWPHMFEEVPHDAVAIAEGSKTLDTVARLTDMWHTRGRPGHWVIVGGGVLSDVAAFAATNAGCTFTFVPTTLLSMADACVGGKTGVNFPPFGKNQVGLFAFPSAVYVWPGWLQSLPEREIRSGLAECYKHAFLSDDPILMERLPHLAERHRSLHHYIPILCDIIRIKANIVEQDPMESSTRAILNFGHTLGHALEAVFLEDAPENEVWLTHGEAVALGMVFATLLSEKLVNLPTEERDTIIDNLRTGGCLIKRAQWDRLLSLKGFRSQELWQAVKAQLPHDKKSNGGQDHSLWVLLNRLGEPFQVAGSYRYAVSSADLDEVWPRFLHLII